MKFTKNKGMTLAMIAIIMMVFNVSAFVLPFERGSSFWVGYSFTMFAVLLTTAIGFYALGREGLKSKFFGMPIALVAWTYLIVQVIVGILEMAVPVIPYQYEIVLNVLLLGACLIGLISVNMGKEEIERTDAKVKEKVFYIKSLQVDIEGFVSHISDESLRKSLKDLADTIRYSDPMSNPQLAVVENQIEVKVAMLAEAVSGTEGDSAKRLIDELQQLFAERNRKCKMLK